jgi:hypothetical protein
MGFPHPARCAPFSHRREEGTRRRPWVVLHMADIGDLKPLTPVWPVPVSDKVARRKRPAERDQQRKPPQREERKGDDDEPHIDEYA